MCPISVSVGQESRKRLAKSSPLGSLTRLQSRTAVSFAFHLQKDLLPNSLALLLGKVFLYRLLAWGPQFIAGYWPEPSLWSLPCGPLQHNSFFHQNQQDTKSTSKMGVTFLYDWVIEVTSHHSYHVLLIRSKSPYLIYTQGGELHRSWTPKVRDHLKPCQKLPDNVL